MFPQAAGHVVMTLGRIHSVSLVQRWIALIACPRPFHAHWESCVWTEIGGKRAATRCDEDREGMELLSELSVIVKGSTRI